MSRRIRSLLRVVRRLVVVLVVLLVLVWVFRGPLLGSWLERTLTDALAEQLGGTYEIDELAGSWLFDLELRGLRTKAPPPAGVLTRLDAERVEVRYGVWRLLRDGLLSGLDDVVVDGLRLELDPGRPTDTTKPTSPVDDDLDEWLAWPGSLTIDGDVLVKTESGDVSLAGLEIRRRPQQWQLNVAEVDLPDHLAVTGPFAGDVKRMAPDRWRWTSESQLGGVRIPQATIDRQGRFEAEFVLSGGSLQITGDDSGLALRTQEFDIRGVPAWMQTLVTDAGDWPRAGRLSLTVRSPWADLRRATFTVSAKAIAWRDEVDLDASLSGRVEDEHRIVIAELRASGRGVALEADDVRVDRRLPYGIASLGRLRADVAQLRRIWPAAPRAGRVRIRAASTDGRNVDVEDIAFEDDALQLQARGQIRLADAPEAWRTSAFDGTLGVEARDVGVLDARLAGRWQGSATVAGTLEACTLSSRITATGGRVEGIPLTGVDAKATLRWPAIEALELRVMNPGSTLAVAGAAQVEPKPSANLQLELNVSDVQVLGTQVRSTGISVPEALQGGFTATGALRVAETTFDVDVDLEGNELRFDGERITNVRAEAIYDGRRVRVAVVRMSADAGGALLAGSVDPEAGRAEIERLTVATPDVHARAAGPFVLRWDDRLIETSDLTVEVEGTRIASDLRVDTGGRWLEATRLLVEREEDRLELLEPLRVERRDEEIEIVLLRARWNDDAEVAVSGQVDTALTRARLTRLDARVDGRPIRMTQPLRLDTRGDQVAVRGLALAGMEDERLAFDADVDLDAHRALLSNVRLAVAGEALVARAPMTIDWREGGVRLSNLDATWRGGVITGKAAYDRAPQATLAFSGISLAGITDELRGTGNGTLALQGTQAALQIDVPDLCLTSPDGPAWCGPLSVRLRHDADVGVRVEELRWQGPDETFQLLGTAHWPYAWVDGQRTRTAGSPALTLDVRGRRWPGSPQALDGPMSLTVRGNSERLELRGLVQDLVWRDATSPRDDVAVTVTVDATRVQGDVRVVGDETARVAGRFALDRGVDWQDPAAWQRLWREARIEGSITADMRNWSHVQALAPGLRTLEGRARLDVEARGRLQRPELRGRLDLKDFRFRVQGDLPTFADLNGTITWEDGRARIPGLTGTLGHAPFRLAGDADVPFDGQPSFDVRLTGDNLLLSRSRHLRLRSNVDLRLEGPLDALRLGGRARLTNALYSAPMSLEGGTGGDDKLQIFSIRDWPFNQMAFDVRIDSDERIRVKNNVLNARIGVDAVLRGTGRTPEPEGRVRFRDTVVKLPLSTLQGAQGELTFTKADPLRPMLRATARSRVKGYDLDVRAWGALPDIELSVYARPQVSPEEALLLLTTGTTREALRVEGITASSFQAIVQTFGGAAIAPLGSPADPDRPSFFDRFDVTVGRFTSREGRSTVEAEFQFGKRVYLRGERDRFDETNVGLVWRVRFR